MIIANEALLESWVLSLHSRRPRTTELYVRNVRWFADWLELSGADLASASKQHAEAWIRDMQQRGLKGNTIRSRVYSLRSFYAWAYDESEVPENPMARVAYARPHEPPPAVLRAEQVTALLKACEGTGFRERRDAAIIRFLCATGVRASELTGLEVGHVDLPHRLATIEGKGGKRRLVRFDPPTAAALDRYKRVRARHKHASQPALWLGERGPITASGGLGDLLNKRARLAGIGDVFPHQLRHTFAHRFLNSGGKEGDLQQLGGWESADIMKRYGSAMAVDRALSAYDDVDPMRGV